MCACALFGASCFPLLSIPGGTPEAFSLASWRAIAILFLEKEKGVTDVKMHWRSFSIVLGVGSVVSNIRQLSALWCLPWGRHPRPSLPRAGPDSRVPSGECLAFSTSTWGNSEGHCGSWSPLGMVLHPVSFYPILYPSSLFHRCWSLRRAFRSICKLIPKLELLPGKPTLWQKTIIYLWIADWIMLFSCLKCLWDEVQTP